MRPNNEQLTAAAVTSEHEPETASPLTSCAVKPSQKPVPVTTADSSK